MINRWTKEYNLKRLAQGDKPLDLSIEHWLDNLAWLETNPELMLPGGALTGQACACCVATMGATGQGVLPSCKAHCIIAQRYGGCYIIGYSAVCEATNHDTQLQATRQLLKNLKELQKEVKCDE